MARAWEQMAVTLMTERYPRLLARARALAVSDDEAADLVQEALVRTFSRNRGFDSVAAAEQYVRRAIVTVFADEAGRAGRERARWNRATQGSMDRAPDTAALVVAATDVASALAGLAPRVRACIALRYLEDLSIKETAAQLGLSEGAVKRYAFDGIAALNVALGTQDVAEDLERVPVRTTEGDRR